MKSDEDVIDLLAKCQAATYMAACNAYNEGFAKCLELFGDGLTVEQVTRIGAHLGINADARTLN